jgi:hypothetical protein
MGLMDGNNFREDDVHPVDFRQASSWIREANRFVADGSSTAGIYDKDELIATRPKYSTTEGWLIQPPAGTLDW